MFATASQLLGLVGLIAGGIILAGLGGFIVGASCVALYVGVAAERKGR